MNARWLAQQGEEYILKGYVDLKRFLGVMARQIQARKPGSNPELLLETRFLGERYSLAVVCRACRLQRFMAVIEEPCAETFVLGRLRKDGTARMFEQGVWLFLGYLLSQGLFQDFLRDLAESLELCASPMGNA